MTEQAGVGAETIEANPASPVAGDRPRDGVARAAIHAAETRRLYAADWAAFGVWCRERRESMLPASPSTVAAYLESVSATLSHGALARRAAAIAGQHRQAGHPSPGTDPAVRTVLRATRAAKRASGEASAAVSVTPSPATPTRRPPPGPARLARMAARCPGDLSGLRDRALLLLTAAGLGGERLLAVDFEHVRFTATGVALILFGPDRGAEEQALVGRVTASAACPVRALESWLHSSETRFGPVFRKVNRWGGVEHRRLRPDALRRIWQRRAKALRAPRRAEDAPA